MVRLFRPGPIELPENRAAFAKPVDYDPAQYELLLRNFEAGDHRGTVECGQARTQRQPGE